MAAHAREVIAANTALSSALSSALLLLEDGGNSSAMALAVVAITVETQATALLLLAQEENVALAARPAGAEGVSRGDQNFAYLVASSGAAILDSASRACASGALTGGLEGSHVRTHVEGIWQLVETMVGMQEARPGALKALRATTCSPDAVLTCLRRHFLRYWDEGPQQWPHPARTGSSRRSLTIIYLPRTSRQARCQACKARTAAAAPRWKQFWTQGRCCLRPNALPLGSTLS